MNTEYIGIIFMYLATVALAIPLGKYIAKVFKGEKTWMDFMAPLERFIFKFSGIDTHREMNWKQHLKALLTINLLWLFYAFFCLLFQGHLPLNPDANPNQTPDLAFNTALSFLTNTNLQDYSGESGATYFTQHFVFMFLHFVSAATGFAAMLVVFKAMKDKTTEKLGNYWDFFLKSITRVLLPISFVVAIIRYTNQL
jgi:K+-transporting ATPase ATPase A chain